MLSQGVSVKEGGEPYTYITEGGERYEVLSATFKFGKKVEVSALRGICTRYLTSEPIDTMQSRSPE